LTLEYDDCLRKGKIRLFSRGRSLSSKELETSASDFERARAIIEK
jgi:hypothetical protein